VFLYKSYSIKICPAAFAELLKWLYPPTVLQELLPVGCGAHAKFSIRYLGNKSQFCRSVHISVQIWHLTLRGLSRSVTGLTMCKPCFDPRTLFVGIMVDKVALYRFSPGTYTLHFQYHSTKAQFDTHSLTYYQWNIILPTESFYVANVTLCMTVCGHVPLSSRVKSLSIYLC